MSNNSNFAAARCRDAVTPVFHTTPTPTVCYSVPSIVEVSGGCQSVNIMSAQPRDYCSEIICILRKIHRLRNHPWLSAQTMDHNGSIDCAGRSMDSADPQIAPNRYILGICGSRKRSRPVTVGCASTWEPDVVRVEQDSEWD